jgi:hypothetical protein
LKFPAKYAVLRGFFPLKWRRPAGLTLLPIEFFLCYPSDMRYLDVMTSGFAKGDFTTVSIVPSSLL